MDQLLGIGEITPEILEGMPDDVAAAVLNGVSPEGQMALLGAIAKQGKTGAYNKFKRAVAAGAVKGQAASAYPNSRVELLNRLGFFPAEFRKALAKGSIRMVDMYYFQTKAALTAAGLVKMFTSGDQKAVGVGNVDKGKLDNDKPFLALGLQITTGVAATVQAASFGIAHSSVINGQITLRHDSKEILKEYGGQNFDTTNKQNVALGLVYFDNPVIIQPNVAIELEIEQAAAAPANTWIKAGFIGTSLNPN